MNEKLAYWQLDFTVEKPSKSGPRLLDYAGKIQELSGAASPGLLYSSAYGLSA